MNSLENEIFGTVLTVLFDFMVAVMIYLFFATENVFGVFPVLVSVAFAGVALWATFKVARYWVVKFKNHGQKG